MFSGLTAVGKTTHSHILARQLKSEYVSATTLLLQEVGYKRRDGGHPWFDDLQHIENVRDLNSKIDDTVDESLLRRARIANGAVFDTWALPWLSDGLPAYRIRLNSDPIARARKAYVSQGLRRNLDEAACLALILEKDERTRLRFKVRRNIDIDDDEAFDVVLDTTRLIPQATFRDARSGILSLKPLVWTLVEATRSPRKEVLHLLEEQITSPTSLVAKMKRPWNFP
jgi:cytidylate kinase